MLQDVIAIPISIVVSESAFRTNGRVLKDYRSSLSPTLVEGLILYSRLDQKRKSNFTNNEDLDDLE